MGCRFCMTGRQGFGHHLTAGEIVNQVLAIPEAERLTNIVFMGMGEPMDNIEEVLRAYLNVSKILWLPRGIYNDETNEHVDNIGAFTAK